ncbi:MAG: aminomethyl-transferring glycine dehydrogenase subunit GcvPA [Oscillospiraceae bacterium]
MGTYVPNSPAAQREMLDAVGVSTLEDLYASVPHQMLLGDRLGLAAGLSELEVRTAVTALAEKNKIFKTVLRGAGAERHFIPAAVGAVTSREELVTAYTPYQAEISQGILQSIFEYQTMICELTGMDVANASVYDVGSAAGEAVAMCRDRKRVHAYISACVHPDVIGTVKTYCFGSDTQVTVLPAKDGKTDLDALRAALGDDAACFIAQQPNYFGQLEDAAAIGEIVHAAGAKYVLSVHPIACALLPTPAEYGADIAVGEGQSLGLDTAFGGPYLGFMATTKKLMRQLPGRIVGETHDTEGNVGYVLTLTAREQHIRREKASSNLCSNQALCAFTAGVYLTAMGETGLRQAASLSLSKAHYFADELAKIGFPRLYPGDFFHEFVTTCACCQADGCQGKALDALAAQGILGGQPVENGILWCVTEVVTKAELDKAISILKEVC